MGTPTLNEYQKSNHSGPRGRWVDSLPEEIKTQIMASTAGERVITLWLLELGYDGATDSKVSQLVNERRRRDATQSK